MTKRQFANIVKVIVVAAVAKEFRKAKIIDRIVKAAKQKGHVASGQLTNPKSSRSLTPFSDDRWLIRKDAVKVSVQTLPSQQYIVRNLTVRVRYGLNFKYQNLSEAFSNKRKWFPPVNAIANWIRSKQAHGQFTDVSPQNVKRVAFAIARKQEQKGIKATKFANPFFNKQTGVEPTLQRGIGKATEKLDRMYATSVERSIARTIQL